MVNEQKVFLYSAEMAAHANGAAQYLGVLLGGRYVTKEQTRDMVGYLFAATKRNIESCPFATQDEKEAEIMENLLRWMMIGTHLIQQNVDGFPMISLEASTVIRIVIVLHGIMALVMIGVMKMYGTL